LGTNNKSAGIYLLKQLKNKWTDIYAIDFEHGNTFLKV
jgi:hypothetical protein